MKPKNLLLALPLMAVQAHAAQPNVIIIMADDQGYQDLGCYGSPLIKTPAIDKMATEGLRLTDFYQSSSVSSASRAGLLTGRFNTHNGVPNVYYPTEGGMPPEEITIAEGLKQRGYATACVGKWHLGDAPEFMPMNQGFDEFYGIPYSNDMYITPYVKISEDVLFRDSCTLEMAQYHQSLAAKSRKAAFSNNLRNLVPLVDHNEIVEYPCDQTTLTRRYFDRAIDFVKRSKGKPFFAYITPAMPHTPLYASEQFKGKSARGLYGDCIEELDWNVGRLLEALEAEGIAENTIVIYTSDNGPWLQRKGDGGSADPLRGGKFTVYDGGVRVPCIIKWPAVIGKGVVSDAVVTSLDLFPTLMHYAGGAAPTHKLDGQNISTFLENPKRIKGLDEYVYIRQGQVRGVRKGDWVYLPYSGAAAKKEEQPELFNLKADISEQKNLIDKNPKVLKELKALYKKHVADSKIK